MNKKIVVIIVAVAFVLLLVGAYALYGKLAEDAAPDQLSVQGEAAPEEAAPKEEKPAEEPTEEATEEPAQEPETGEEAEEPAKTPAPDFKVYDLAGNEVHLSDFVGKPVVVNFWATWCGYCKMEMPEFEKKYQELGDEIQFMMVDLADGSGETVEAASAYIEENGYTFPVFYDTDTDAAMTYGVYSLPTTYFIDAEGNAIAQASGALDGETLQRGIDMILPRE